MKSVPTIDNIFEILAGCEICKKDVQAIFLHGSATAPYVKNNRDYDFIAIVKDKINIKREFVKEDDIELHIYNRTAFNKSHTADELSIRHYVVNHCYLRPLYETKAAKLMVPFDKFDKKVIKLVLNDLSYCIYNAYDDRLVKYFYWFLIWAKDLGCNISEAEINKAHDTKGNIDRTKYSWIIGKIKNEYNIL